MVDLLAVPTIPLPFAAEGALPAQTERLALSRHEIIDSWAPTVVSAELAHGTLVRCGPGVRLAAWPETSETRAEALSRVIGARLMPVLFAAAWVWGCVRDPGSPIVCALQKGARPKLNSRSDVQVHEYRYPERELVRCGVLTLPGPLRTACDLLRLCPRFTLEVRVTTRLLLLRADASSQALVSAIHEGPGRNRVRALRRISELVG